MIETIEVDGRIWSFNPYRADWEGSDAKVYTSDDYPDVVLMIFRDYKTYKYDWYKYLDLILGQSKFEDNYVLVLPFMEHVSPLPEWYKHLDIITYDGINEAAAEAISVRYEDVPLRYAYDPYSDKGADRGVETLEWIERYGTVSGDLAYWIDKLLEFVSIHPQYNSDDYTFDLSSGNIMSYRGRDIITDPILGR